MNLCGAQYDHHFENQEMKAAAAALCGPCAKDSNERKLDESYLDSNDDDIREGQGGKALDTIVETIDNKDSDEDDREGGDRMSTPQRTAYSSSSNAGTSTPGRTSLNGSSASLQSLEPSNASTPSPLYLNPMSGNHWQQQMKQSIAQSELRCPSLDEPSSSTIPRLMKRLQGGFRLLFHLPDYQSATEQVTLYLDKDRKMICLQTDEDEKKEEEGVNYWKEIPLETIVRLEIGGTKNRTGMSHLNAFAIVASHNSSTVNYDFVASTPIERELIVSTLMVVIDQTQTGTTTKEGINGHRRRIAAVSKQNSSNSDDDRETTFMAEKFSSIVHNIEGSRRAPGTSDTKSLASIAKEGISRAVRGGVPVVVQASSGDKTPALTEKKNIVLVQGIDELIHCPSASNDTHDPTSSTCASAGLKNIHFVEDCRRTPKEVPEKKMEENFNFGGTMDAPIPCSPSLEEQLLFKSDSEFGQRRGGAKPFNSKGGERNDDKLVIHLEDMLSMEETESVPDQYDSRLGMVSPRFGSSDVSDNENKLIDAESVAARSVASDGKGRWSSSQSVSSSRTSKSMPSFRMTTGGRSRNDAVPHGSHRENASKPIDAEEEGIGRKSPFALTNASSPSPKATPENLQINRSSSESRHTAPGTDVIIPAHAKQAEDLMLDFTPNSGQLASVWCGADNDLCTFALKDITDTCTSVFTIKQVDNGCSMPTDCTEQQELIEEYVANALGAPSAFYTYLTESERWKEDPPPDDKEAKIPVGNNRVRNRSGVLNAQSNRMRRLRSEMTFAAALKKSRKGMHVQTTRSFDDTKLLSGGKADEAVERFHSSALLQHVMGTMISQQTVAEEEEDDVKYYDSDPEDARPRTLHRKCPRQARAEMDHAESTDSETITSRPIPSGFEKIKSTKRVSKKLDEDSIVQIVQVYILRTFLNRYLLHALIFTYTPSSSPLRTSRR